MSRISRAQWGARPAKTTSDISLPTIGVTFHWEGPKMGAFDHAVCDDKVRGIQAFHMDTRGWADVAYSHIVCPHGDVYEGRGAKYRTAANGTNDGNNGWHAVCYLGGDGDGFTDAGKRGMVDARAWLRENGAGQATNSHRDHKATACPGDAIAAWVKAGCPVPGAVAPTPVPTTPTITKGPTMVIVLEPGSTRQWLCTTTTKRHLGSTERPAWIAAGVPYLDASKAPDTARAALLETLIAQ